MNRRLTTSVPYFLARVPRVLDHVSPWAGSGAAVRFARRRLAATRLGGALPQASHGFWRRLFFAHRFTGQNSRVVSLEAAVRRDTVQPPPEVRVHTLVREVERVRYVTRPARAIQAATPWLPRRLLLPPAALPARLRERLSAPLQPATSAHRTRMLQYLVTSPRVVRDVLVDGARGVESSTLPPTTLLPTARAHDAPVAPSAPAPTPGLPSIGTPAPTFAPVSVEPSTGAPLSPALRRTIRRRLGFDPVGVRIHTGESAQRATRELRAAAFTLAENIYFARGRFDPTTPSGRDLLVHELIHVRQQPDGRPFRAGELSPIRLAALEADARGAASARPTRARPPLVLAPSVASGPAPSVPLLADETSSAVASPTPTEEPTSAAAPAGGTPPAAAAPPAAASPPDARQVADEVYKLIERRLRIERERTGVQRWR